MARSARIFLQATSKRKPKMRVQTLIFSRKRFKFRTDAKEWARKNKYSQGKITITPRTWRMQQNAVNKFDKRSFRTITLAVGVTAVMGTPKRGSSNISKTFALP